MGGGAKVDASVAATKARLIRICPTSRWLVVDLGKGPLIFMRPVANACDKPAACGTWKPPLQRAYTGKSAVRSWKNSLSSRYFRLFRVLSYFSDSLKAAFDFARGDAQDDRAP